MAPILESETQLALEQLQQAESQASVLESRLDQLDSTLDSLLNKLVSGEYGASRTDVERVMQDHVPTTQPPPPPPPGTETGNNDVPWAADGPSSVVADQSDLDEQEALATHVVRHLERSQEQREREKEQESKLLDMMDA